jgi:uncharacterized protein DUF1559
MHVLRGNAVRHFSLRERRVFRWARGNDDVRLRRRGLTLTEVLVIIVLAVVGIAIFLVYLQGSRDHSRRTRCANNLKLLGEAIYYFEGSAKSLKAAKLNPAGRGEANHFLPAARIADGYATWAVQIAPYLNNNPLPNWNLEKTYFAQSDDVRQGSVPEMFCPARDRDRKLSDSGDVDAQGVFHAGAVGDYACVAGDGDPQFPWTGATANGPIILGEVLQKKDDLIVSWRSRTDFASLKRGVSYTVLVGEKHVPIDKLGQADAGDGSIYNGSQPASFSRVGGPGYGIALTPSAPFKTNFGSYHAGICQFLNADTSIRVLTTKVDENVLGKLTVRE